jgi:penicillin-binding protein 2
MSAFVVLFSMLGIRLWFIQVAEGAKAAVEVSNQSWIVINTPAPRGDILDRKGVLLATSQFVPAVVVDRNFITSSQRADLVQNLSALLNIPAGEVDKLYDAAGINGRFTLALIDPTLAYRISEQLRDLPGVRIEKIPQRVYLSGTEMAHVIGHLGLPTEDDLAADPELDPNTRIGKLGVEKVYDQYLQGTPGSVEFQVRQSQIVDERPEVAPVQGDAVYLTLDSDLQTVVEKALADGVKNANDLKAQLRAQAKKGALHDVVRAAAVVLDVTTGEVLAMASLPTFDPSDLAAGIDQRTFDQLNSERAFNNLAIAGLYPPASTFKAITYLAELEHNTPFPTDVEGVDPGSRLVNCDGELKLGSAGLEDQSQKVFHDWYYGTGRTFGWLDEHGALQYSCNIYFWSVALGIWRTWKNTGLEDVIQDQARSLGFGKALGIDLPGEADGVIPDKALYEEYKKLMLESDNPPSLLSPDRLEAASPWYGGDLMNVAIGQGGVTATPLQVATAYAAIANGGKVWRPYVVDQVRDTSNQIVYSGQPTLVNDARLDPNHVQSLLTDLHRVVSSGTAAGAFAGFGSSLSEVGGKTGTGQSVKTKDNHAWFAGVAPISDPKYAVAVVVDEGGSGGAVAAPIARYILQYLMGEELDPIVAGDLAD